MSAIAANHFAYTQARRPERGRMSQDDVTALVEIVARDLLGVTPEEAFAMLDRGELEGTFSASAMRSMRFLLDA